LLTHLSLSLLCISRFSFCLPLGGKSTDKIVTVEKTLLGNRIGSLTGHEMSLVSGKLAKVLEIHKSDIEED
jgi:hypothetical protein